MAADTAGGERFDTGRVVRMTTAAIGRNPLLFAGAGLLLSALPEAATLLFKLDGAGLGFGIDADTVAPIAAYFVNSLLLGSVLQTLIVTATLQDAQRGRVDVAACCTRALVICLPVAFLNIVAFLGMLLGFLLLVVPGVIVALMWTVAVPVRVEERVSWARALGRSRDLTRGARGAILGLILLFGLAAFMLGLAAGLFHLLDVGDAVAPVAQSIATAITAVVGAAGVAAIYVELRNVKEGAPTDRLAEIFS